MRFYNSLGEKISGLPGRFGKVTDLAWSPDRKLLAIGTGDDSLQLWNVASKTELANLIAQPKGEISSLAWSA